MDNRPTVLNLKEVLQIFLEHRRQVVLRHSYYDLAKAEARLHILDGYPIALGLGIV